MKYSETAVVYECEKCGERVIVDTGNGEQPPEKCPWCGHEENKERDEYAEIEERR